jgi:ssRNA-specific RNase YbeY (16S rRNA maturation enzyme)
LLRSDLGASAVEIKDLKHKLNHSFHYTVLSPLCEACVSLKGMFFNATKENNEFKLEVAYLTAHFLENSLKGMFFHANKENNEFKQEVAYLTAHFLENQIE